MNTLFARSSLNTIISRCLIGIVSLTILMAPLSSFPPSASAETLSPTTAQQAQSSVASQGSTDQASVDNTGQTGTLSGDAPIVTPPTDSTITPSSQQGSTPETNSPQSVPPSTSTPIAPDNATTATGIDTTLNSTAISGDTTATNNSTVGTISTGDATAATTNLNMLMSSISLSGNTQPISFSYDINGNVTGDILIDPTVLNTNTAYPAVINPSPNSQTSSDLQANITNNLNLTAMSGDVAALSNSTTGDISTGSANSMANIINLINSAVAANQSFIGTIDIYGDLNGDILLPASFVGSLLSAGIVSPESLANSSVITTDLNATINNNILSSAQSGDITVLNNSSTGDIASGAATTKVKILNLTGKQTISKNMLLVFVNVLGTWSGLLFDAPAGTTTAALGGPGDSATINETHPRPDIAGPYSVAQKANLSITNNINLAAKSGDATVVKNSQTGNIQTGTATTSANILNILNSQLSLSDWFGVLFINVFGNWLGSLAFAPEPTPYTSDSDTITATSNEPPRLFTFSTANKPKTTRISYSSTHNILPTSSDPNPEVAGDSMEPASRNFPPVHQDKDPAQDTASAWFVVLGIIVVAGGVGTRYYLSRPQ